MAKRFLQWNEEKLQRFLKEGRGTGELETYKPWLTIQDFPSLGRASRVRGIKTGRIHSLFTDSQLRYFYLLEYEEKVFDIKEHFPMLDIDAVLKNKSDINLKMFTDRNSNCPYILCTTFLISIMTDDNKIKQISRGVKGASELTKKTTLEKLEIERRYWIEKEVDFRLVTNKDIPLQRVKNIEWMYSASNELSYGHSNTEISELSTGLFERLTDSKKSIINIIKEFESDYGTDSGIGVNLFKSLILKKLIIIDIDKPIDLNKRLAELQYGNDMKIEGS